MNELIRSPLRHVYPMSAIEWQELLERERRGLRRRTGYHPKRRQRGLGMVTQQARLATTPAPNRSSTCRDAPSQP